MTTHLNIRRCQTWPNPRPRMAFTLVEMTIVVMVIAILAALALPVFVTAQNQAKAHRTRAMVAKIDQIIGEKWDAFRTRQVPIRVNPLTPPQNAAIFRLTAMRELQRFEMPDRITDVTAGPAYGVSPDSIPQAGFPVYALAALASRPAINKQFLRYAFQAHAPGAPLTTGLQYWSSQHENAECLYLILAVSRDGDNKALDWFSPSEIGDVDDDGMKEVLDGWGQPIAFLRWPAGYRADVTPFPVTTQRRNDTGLDTDETTYPDVFDPFKVDFRWNDGNLLTDPIILRPLIWSAGPDKRHDIDVGGGFVYAATLPANDPYVSSGAIGQPIDTNNDGTLSHGDNITNHDLEAR